VRGAGGLGARARGMVPSLLPPHPRAAREMEWEVEVGAVVACPLRVGLTAFVGAA
jgi:hypothetical protein